MSEANELDNVRTVFSMKKYGTRTSLIVALLFLALFAFDPPAAALSNNKEAKRRLDIKFNPVVDLSYMIRKYATSKSELPGYMEPFQEAVGVARELNGEFGGWVSGGWPVLDSVLSKCKTTSDAMQAVSQVPETITSRSGLTIRVREAAVRYAKALNAVEPSYLKDIWPKHKAIAERTTASIANNFARKEQECFAYVTTNLGMPDTDYQVPVFLVAETPWPGAFTFWDATRRGTVVVSVEANPGSVLFETLLHEAIHALDLETEEKGNVLMEIRARLKTAGVAENEITLVQGTHLIVFMQAGETIRRLIEPSHQHYGDVRGVYAYDALRPLANVARPVWMAYLDKKISRETAINQIVEGFLRVRKETPRSSAEVRNRAVI